GDVLRLYELVQQAVDEIRSGSSGPRFFECMAYRWKEHVGPNEDFDAGYRARSEAGPWFANDQVKRLGDLVDSSVRQKIEAEVEAEIREAFEFAEQSPFPDDEELYTDMFKGA